MDGAALFDVPNLDGFATVGEMRCAETVLSLLAAYAGHQAYAMDMRRKGDIQAALASERAADAVYRRLPDWARW